MSKLLKTQMADQLQKKLAKTDSFIAFGYSKLKSQQSYEMRKLLREQNVSVTVLKNSVSGIVFSKLFSQDAAKLLQGQTAIAYGVNIVSLSKAVLDWNKKSKSLLAIKGGYLPGKLLNEKDLEALAKFPPKEALLGMIAGGFVSPLQKVATLSVAPLQKMSFGISALIKKMEDAKVDKIGDLKV